MDVSELGTANQLVDEAGALSNAINIFYSEGSRVSAVMLTATDGRNATVNALSIAFPTEVLEAVINSMWARYAEITGQLDAMGITGYPSPHTGRSQAEAASTETRAPKGRRK